MGVDVGGTVGEGVGTGVGVFDWGTLGENQRNRLQRNYTRVCVDTYVRVYVCVCALVYMCLCLSMYVCEHVYVCVRAYVCVRVHVCVRTCVHMCTREAHRVPCVQGNRRSRRFRSLRSLWDWESQTLCNRVNPSFLDDSLFAGEGRRGRPTRLLLQSGGSLLLLFDFRETTQ